MNRLTERTSDGIAYTKIPLDMWVEICKKNNVSIVQFKKWAEAEQDGRLVVLPVKVGDTVYWRSHFGSVASGKVSGMRLTKHFGIDLQIESEEKPNSSVWREMEKVFLTREAAEKALEVGE